MALPPNPNRHRNDLGGVILGALAIVLGSAALGIAVNHFAPHRVPIVLRAEAGRLPLPQGLTSLTLAQAKSAFDKKETPFLDARGSQTYAAGHITGAHDLPTTDFEKRFLDLAETLEGAPSVIIYCESADCGEAVELAARLKEAYQGTILVFVDGVKGWTAAGYPVTKGETP